MVCNDSDIVVGKDSFKYTKSNLCGRCPSVFEADLIDCTEIAKVEYSQRINKIG